MKKSKILLNVQKKYLIQRFEVLDSTNQYIKKNVNKLQNFTVVWSEEQTQGRGRLKRTWNSIPGRDLTFSLLLPLDHMERSSWTNITQIAALAVAEIIQKYGISGMIKWPNDVLVDGKKVCGILCESFNNSNHYFAALGIGININSEKNDLVKIDQPATSLYNERHVSVSRDRFLRQFIDHFIPYFNNLIEYGFKPFHNSINSKLAYRNEMKSLIEGNTKYKAKIVGINENGLLLIEKEDNAIIHLVSGEIQFEKDYPASEKK